MARYILIDNSSGYIWGDTGLGPARDETFVEAATRLDHANGIWDRIYIEHTPNRRLAANATAYHVYLADDTVPLVDDGQDQAAIDLVEQRCPKIAVVEILDPDE